MKPTTLSQAIGQLKVIADPINGTPTLPSASARVLLDALSAQVGQPDDLRDTESPRERRDRVMELLKAVDLVERAKNRPDQLSGGQQQRIAIARALAPKPALILADEPTANLDTENGRQVMQIMEKLNKDTGVTFVFATHDPRVIQYAHRVVTLRDGQIVENNGTGK